MWINSRCITVRYPCEHPNFRNVVYQQVTKMQSPSIRDRYYQCAETRVGRRAICSESIEGRERRSTDQDERCDVGSLVGR
jgi:hypothetical protein